MALCRWSDMDDQCDLYVYESDDGITIHVAQNRVTSGAESADDDVSPIGGPYDGQSLFGLSRCEAIAWLQRLREAGYVFPADLIQILENE